MMLRYAYITLGIVIMLCSYPGTMLASEVTGESLLKALKQGGVKVFESQVRTDSNPQHNVGWFYLGGDNTIFEYRSLDAMKASDGGGFSLLSSEKPTMNDAESKKLCRAPARSDILRTFKKDRLVVTSDGYDRKNLRILRKILGKEIHCQKIVSSTDGDE